MRPLKLTVSAFAAYKNETTVEFEKLGKSGLYLISGNTGSGKTTLFDGITFALYGEPSGDVRKADSLRSKYADGNVPTFAELVFECRGKVYTIKRNPAYERPRKDGKGMTKESASAVFTGESGVIATGPAEVTEAVEKLLGVKRSQFTQIAMIAQGDFLKLLLASTKERQEVFRRLFDTEKYMYLQEAVKKDWEAADREYKELDEKIKGYRPAEEAFSGEELIEYYRDELAKADEESAAADKKESENMKAQTELTEQLTKAREIKKQREALEKARADIVLLSDKKAAAENSFKLACEKRTLIADDKARTAEIRAVLPRYDELEEKLSLKEKTAGEVLSAKSGIDSLTLTLESVRVQLEKDTAEREGLKACGAEAEIARAAAKELSGSIQSLAELSLRIKEYNSLSEDYDKAVSEYLDVQARYKSKNEDYLKKETAFFCGQAGVLASRLEEGKPCMVCGSCEHPSPAPMQEDVPEKDELDRLKEENDSLNEELSEKRAEAGKLKGQLETKKSELDSLCLKLLGEDNANAAERTSALIDEKKKLLSEKNAEVSRMEKGAERCKALDGLISDGQTNLGNIRTQLTETEKLLAAKQAELKGCAEIIEKLSSELEFKDKKQAQDKISQLEKSAKEMEDSIALAEKNAKDADVALADRRGAEKSLEEQLADAAEYDIAALEKSKSDLEAEKLQLDSDKKELAVRSVNIKNAIDEITRLLEKSEKLGKKLKWLTPLNDTANGKRSENGKIMLETYIQTMYFDRIIGKANIRFEKMTDGQYSFKRCKNVSSRRSQIGLELDVIDRCNGSERSVSTLSGGEAFKASLSLALGLSDVVREAAGGVRLDSMFIDEGFGSLDRDSVNQALTALDGVGSSGCLVGIISHVDALKSRIERQIRITKDSSGCSKVDIINI